MGAATLMGNLHATQAFTCAEQEREHRLHTSMCISLSPLHMTRSEQVDLHPPLLFCGRRARARARSAAVDPVGRRVGRVGHRRIAHDRAGRAQRLRANLQSSYNALARHCACGSCQLPACCASASWPLDWASRSCMTWEATTLHTPH